MNLDALLVDFENKLFDFFADVLGNRNIYFHGTNFIKPIGDYIVLRTVTFDPIGWPTKIGYTPIGEVIQAQDYEVLVEISAYRGSPFARLEDLKQALTSGWTSRKLKDQKISLIRWGSISNRDVPIDDVSWEKRALRTFLFSIRLQTTDTTPVEDIGSVEVSTNVNNTQPLTEIITE